MSLFMLDLPIVVIFNFMQSVDNMFK
jgi:hypothetical protein